MTSRGTLRRGATTVVALLVTTAVLGTALGPAAAATKKADIVFVFDKTGSMDEQAAALKDEIENVTAEMDAAGIDARYALVTYEGADNTEVRLQLISDTQALEDELGFSTEGGTENVSHGIQVGLDLDFREDAKKIVVVITDEDDDGSDDSRARTIDRLNAESACLVSVSPEFYLGSVDDELKTMAEQVDCGRWTDIESGSFTDVVTDVVDIIEEVTGDAPAGVGANFEVTEATAEETTAYLGETVNVRFTVENTGGSSGEYDALLTTMGEIHYTDEAEIGVGESRTFTATVSFDELGTHNLRLNHRAFATVTVERPPPAPLGAADVELVDAHVTRSTVLAGESYDVVSVVENVGNGPGQVSVAFADDVSTNGTSNGSSTETVVLDSGETAEVRHTATHGAATTTHAWSVSAAGSNATHAGNVTVLSADDAESGVVDAFTAPRTVETGETYDVTAVVHNAADEEQLFVVTFAAQDGVSETKMLWVDAGDTVEFAASYTASGGAGTVDWTVNGVPTAVIVTGNGTAAAS